MYVTYVCFFKIKKKKTFCNIFCQPMCAQWYRWVKVGTTCISSKVWRAQTKQYWGNVNKICWIYHSAGENCKLSQYRRKLLSRQKKRQFNFINLDTIQTGMFMNETFRNNIKCKLTVHLVEEYECLWNITLGTETKVCKNQLWTLILSSYCTLFLRLSAYITFFNDIVKMNSSMLAIKS